MDLMYWVYLSVVLFTIGGLLLALSGVLLHSLGHFTGRLRE